MRSRVEVVADVDDAGRTVLARMRADGALAVRRTGSSAAPPSDGAVVHLVGTAAGPLTGDVVEVDVEVRDGARLTVAGVAATIALPGPGPAPARWDVRVRAAGTARVVVAPQPLVVCAGARLVTTTAVTADVGATVDVLEQVVLGRHGEPGGEWSGRLVADVGGAPAVRQTQDGALLRLPPHEDGVAPRAVVSRLLLVPATAAVARTTGLPAAVGVSGGAVRCLLARGGELLSAVGVDLARAVRDLDALRREAVPAVRTS